MNNFKFFKMGIGDWAQSPIPNPQGDKFLLNKKQY